MNELLKTLFELFERFGHVLHAAVIVFFPEHKDLQTQEATFSTNPFRRVLFGKFVGCIRNRYFPITLLVLVLAAQMLVAAPPSHVIFYSHETLLA